MALLCAGYGWDVSQVRVLTNKQQAYFLKHLPLVEARKAYPIAQLEASLKNALGGKPEKGGEGKSIPPERLYNAEELLPFYAAFGQKQQISVKAIRDIQDNLSSMPSWALPLIPSQVFTS